MIVKLNLGLGNFEFQSDRATAVELHSRDRMSEIQKVKSCQVKLFVLSQDRQ
jgi:hypothetical protein